MIIKYICDWTFIYNMLPENTLIFVRFIEIYDVLSAFFHCCNFFII